MVVSYILSTLCPRSPPRYRPALCHSEAAMPVALSSRQLLGFACKLRISISLVQWLKKTYFDLELHYRWTLPPYVAVVCRSPQIRSDLLEALQQGKLVAHHVRSGSAA